MDPDSELDVTLSNGRRVVADQIAALDRDLGRWTVADPVVPRRVILGDAEALDARRRLDARIAARLAAEWCGSSSMRMRPASRRTWSPI